MEGRSDGRTVAAAGIGGGDGGRVALFSAAPAVADPAPFDSTSGTCGTAVGEHSVIQGNVNPGPNVDVIARAQVSGDSGDFYGEENGPAGDLDNYAGPDTMWLDVGAWNEQPLVALTCGTASPTYTVTFYARPTAPVSFTGASSFTGGSDGPFISSELPFITPSTDTYQAVLTLTQGAVRFSVGGLSPVVTAASSGIYNLGQLPGGQDEELAIEALDGPQAQWTITIRPTPVTISSASVSPTSILPGQLQTISYDVSGDTRLTATITTSSDRTVRVLASSLPVAQGLHTLTWDGRNNGGSPLSAGRYLIHLHSVDAQGNVSDRSGPITIPQVYVNCLPRHGGGWSRSMHPRSCDLMGLPEDEADLTLLRDARNWVYWGTRTTTTTGRALNTHPGMGGPKSVPASLELYGVVRGCGGRDYYTRERIHTRYGTFTLRLSSACLQSFPPF